MLAYLRKHITVKLRSVVQTAGHFGVIQEAVESNIKVLCFIRPYHLSLIAAVAECETKYVLGKSACRNGADSSTADKCICLHSRALRQIFHLTVVWHDNRADKVSAACQRTHHSRNLSGSCRLRQRLAVHVSFHTGSLVGDYFLFVRRSDGGELPRVHFLHISRVPWGTEACGNPVVLGRDKTVPQEQVKLYLVSVRIGIILVFIGPELVAV